MITAIIAEDDPIVALFNQHFLSRFNEIEIVSVFFNGKQALEYLLSNSVNLAVVDITMPGMNGTQLVREARERGVTTDFIVVTAANDIAHIDEMVRYGIVDYLIKPFTMERFSAAITKYLAKNRLFTGKRELSQGEIDRIIGKDTPETSALPKGMQEATMNTLLGCIRQSGNARHTCESISRETSLSKVTVRRYLNYLVKSGVLNSEVDYETGGR
ncbi:MAG: response regulator, partial [Clostridia bacterium]|nr:response regulator [Clostridia bacterium]